jgi:2-oxoglutarate ferredoxin oxidoreductase subunit beta
MSPCVTYNKINTYAWFKEHTYYVDDAGGYDPADRSHAFDALLAEGKIPLGVIYRDGRPTLESLMHLPTQPLTSLDLESTKQQFEGLQAAYR